jgi:branched-chain amino acid transport system substrate-binding protein
VRHRSLVKLGAPVLVGALVLTACGSRSEGGGSGDTGGDKTTVKIGVIAPLTGDLSALGLGIKNSADLAAKKANEKNEVPGVTFEIQAEDDQAQPAVAQQAATKLAGDKTVVGVVGTLNSSTSQSVQPVLSGQKLLQISPANTNPSLTQGADWKTNKKRQYETYFRTATTDAIQGPFAAQYLYNDAKVTQVATIHDKKTYGQGLVETFTEEFKKLGGTVVAAETVNPDDKDFSAVITRIQGKAPKAVYYGGEYPVAAPLSEQMKSKGVNIPLMGGDGIYSGDFIKLTKGKGVNDLATSVGAPTETLESAKTFVEDYKKAGYKEPYEAYGAYSYDAAWTIIQAVKSGLGEVKGSLPADGREKVTKAAQSVSFDGTTGKVAFDEFGDTTTKVLTVYKVEGAGWKPTKTDEFK